MLSEENILKFKSNLGKLQNAVGFTWLLRSDQAYSEIVADVESIVFSQKFLEVDDKRMFLENALLVTEEVIKEISNKTVGQTSNENWLIIRKNRLTSSNFGPVLAAIKSGIYSISLFKRLTGNHLALYISFQYLQLWVSESYTLEELRQFNGEEIMRKMV
ncbi:hypothetical protein HHI36_016613 [Cryptolaemus montrouzieri]|uniref:Uncharacterized protein n=1 Tax=Cryptolaemus montrouzieri TaxID=559131 RepID=A0ABD2NKG3_9CUCU